MEVVKAFEKLFDEGLLKAFIKEELADLVFAKSDYFETQSLIWKFKKWGFTIRGESVKGTTTLIFFSDVLVVTKPWEKLVKVPHNKIIRGKEMLTKILNFLDKNKPPKPRKRKPLIEDYNKKMFDGAIQSLEEVMEGVDTKLLREELAGTYLFKVPYRVIPILGEAVLFDLVDGVTRSDTEKEFYDIKFDSNGVGTVDISGPNEITNISGLIQTVRSCRKTEEPGIKPETLKLVFDLEETSLKSVNIFRELPKFVFETEDELLPNRDVICEDKKKGSILKGGLPY